MSFWILIGKNLASVVEEVKPDEDRFVTYTADVSNSSQVTAVMEDIGRRFGKIDILINNAGLICITAGMTCVMLTGGIDISVGSLVAMDCMILAVGIEQWGWSSPVLMLLILAIGIIFGIVQGFLVAYLDIQPFIVTLAGMFFGRGMTAIISTDMISIKNELFLKWANFRFYMPFGSTNKKGKFIPAYIPPTVVIAVIVVIVIAVLLKYRKFGRKLYAIGGNRQSALMMGLNVKRTMFQAYVLDGFLAGLGGFLFCLNSCAGFVEQAKGLEMDAISSAVIGGTLLSGVLVHRSVLCLVF